jgi:hypothetical protein
VSGITGPIAWALMALLVVTAEARAQGHGGNPKPAADEQAPAAAHAQTKPDRPAKRHANGGSAKAPHAAASSEDGSSDNPRESATHADDQGAHREPPDEAPRRVRPASAAELESITQRIKEKIVALPPVRPRPQARPQPRPVPRVVARVRADARMRLVWRPTLSWPPALDLSTQQASGGDERVRVAWETDGRCTQDPAPPELSSSTWPTMAGLAPNRCCGLFMKR